MTTDKPRVALVTGGSRGKEPRSLRGSADGLSVSSLDIVAPEAARDSVLDVR